MKNKLIKVKDWFINTFKNKPSNIVVPIFSIINFIITILLFNLPIALIILVMINLVYFGYIFVSKKMKDNNDNIFKRFKNWTIKEFKTHPINILVIIVSILILIVSIIKFSLIVGIVVFIIIHLVYWGYIFMSNRPKNSKKIKNSSKTNKKVVKKKGRLKKLLKVLLLLFLILFIFAVIGIVAFIIYIVKTAPEFNEKLLYLTEPSIILDKDGNEVAKVGAERRTMITYDDLSEVMIDAIVATEDSNFFEHNGVDWARFFKASVLQVLGKS